MDNTNNHWSKASEAGTILGMRILLTVYRIFGQRGFRVFLVPVMAYYYLTRKEARKASKQYLSMVTPFIPPASRVSLSSFKHFMMFGEILLDKFLAWMGHFGKNEVVFETPTVFNKIGSDDKGGIIIVSHLGNAEICSALTNQLPDIRLTALVHTQHADKFNTLIKKVNSRACVEMLQVTEISPATAMILSERIEAGEYIIIAGDRTPVTGQNRVSKATFLGGTAPMPQGAFILAALLKCPVYLMFCLKQQTRYHIYIELLTEQLKFPRRERSQAINSAVQDYTDRLEHYCIKAPLQWFNFYPFWTEDTSPYLTDPSLRGSSSKQCNPDASAKNH
ncbi:lipid A biosynthesis acyltransferase [Motiliproteus sp. MSK22-1]|uniref:lipid A biosynthesis acyltransferase n=1 Tax=Motiliproteus sp. MSK22-1 TaxID=1897630 RepID=UPI00097695E4|nr:lipid A biosynthesis acyltransferase [Motiliproteus sp. MSK22-1]OMH31685.1 lipid A biosynthesis acyltransferase [Motiliproteus sp. MSK22-1]